MCRAAFLRENISHGVVFTVKQGSRDHEYSLDSNIPKAINGIFSTNLQRKKKLY